MEKNLIIAFAIGFIVVGTLGVMLNREPLWCESTEYLSPSEVDYTHIDKEISVVGEIQYLSTTETGDSIKPYHHQYILEDTGFLSRANILVHFYSDSVQVFQSGQMVVCTGVWTTAFLRATTMMITECVY